MRPLKLRLGGFTCFREAAEVSFEELSLFAISGPTGSGKSTLLDAITYALYGETARLGSQVGASLISPGLEKLSVTFEFSTDGDAVYRVTRISERRGEGSPKRETRLERLDGNASWRQLPESEKLREADQKLAQIIGLDYSSFTRAVLLPQGGFDAFLRGSAAERNRLLVKLLGLEGIRAMQQEAGERARDAERGGRGIRELLEQEYGDARPERKRELTDELTSLKARQEELEACREAAAAELAGLDEVKALLDAQAEVRKDLKTLHAQKGEIAQDRQTVSRARDAALILPQLEALEGRQARLRDLSERQAAAERELAEATVACERDRAALTEAEKEAERLPELGERLEALAGVRPLLGQLKAKGGSLASAGEEATEYSDALWDALQMRESRLGELRRAVEDVTEAEKAAKVACAAQIEAKQAVADLEATLQEIAKRGKASKTRLEEAQSAYERAELADRAVALRPHLHLGEPCPVCAQVVQTLPPEAESHLSSLREARDEAEREHRALQDSYREENASLKAARSRLADRDGEVEKTAAGLARAEKRRLETVRAFADFGDRPEEIEAALRARRQALLAGLAQSILQKSQGCDPDEAHARLSAERRRLEQALRTAQRRYQDVERGRDRIHSRLESLREQLGELTSEVTGAEQGFADALRRAGFADAEALRAAALPPARLEALEARIKNYESQRESAERRDVELAARLAGRTLDEEAYDALKAQRDETQVGLEQVQQRVGAVKGELERLTERLARAEELEAQVKTLEQVYATYRTLHQDLSSNRFPDFIMARVQRELAQRASAIIREVTDGRYDLTFEGGEYSVLDAWGAGEPRSARTLSGGESFITSLALALALSDTLAGNRSLGALFLDEGFGTLDAETLDAVTAVLESLTESGRMVGVITHVSALTERLPARLLVTKGPDGSRLAWDG